MMRGMYAAISGLEAHQTMLDVTANNLANVDTIGYKAQRTTFVNELSQLIAGSSGQTASNGGTNPIQVGLGVQVAATHTNFLQGSSQVTGRATDLMIQGDGFFVVKNNGENMYTRAGAFTFEQDVGGFEHIGIIGHQSGHLGDAPFALEAHAAAPVSLGRRTRL